MDDTDGVCEDETGGLYEEERAMAMTDRTDDIVVCRCEEVTLGQIRRWIDAGYDHPDELKRLLRVGMGPCQGRGCRDIVIREIAARTGRSVADVAAGGFRPLTKGVKLGVLASGGEEP